jgi:serine/threonine protein kinase
VLTPDTLFDGRFLIVEPVGSGGMGCVYRARQKGLERTVALKVLDPVLMKDERERRRFEREAKILSILEHPGIAGFYGYGNCAGLDYIYMEFVEGRSLRQELIDKGRLSLPEVLEMSAKICEALAYAHAQGVIHRDLKPENIILTAPADGSPLKIIDFGLAKLVDKSGSTSGQRLTESGVLLGSICYMSPEICSGKKADQRTDIYSLACIIYELVCGEPPFSADNPPAVLFKHAKEPMPALRSRPGFENLPEVLDRVLARALAKQPAERYQSAIELRNDLKKIASGQTDTLLVKLPAPAGKQAVPEEWSASGLPVVFISIVLVLAFLGSLIWLRQPPPDLRKFDALTDRSPHALGSVHWGARATTLEKIPGKEDECINCALRALKALDYRQPEHWAWLGRYNDSLNIAYTRKKDIEHARKCSSKTLYFNNLVRASHDSSEMAAAFSGDICMILHDYGHASGAYKKASSDSTSLSPFSASIAGCTACARLMEDKYNEAGDKGVEAQDKFKQSLGCFERLKANFKSNPDRDELGVCLEMLHLVISRRGESRMADYAPILNRYAALAIMSDRRRQQESKAAGSSKSSKPDLPDFAYLRYAEELLTYSRSLAALNPQTTKTVTDECERLLRSIDPERLHSLPAAEPSLAERILLDK